MKGEHDREGSVLFFTEVVALRRVDTRILLMVDRFQLGGRVSLPDSY